MIAKRVFDISFALIGLLLFAPLLILIGLWIKIDSNGPVFFRQERVGRFGQTFRIFKFRTMVPDIENKARLITVGEDPRITKFGHFLRKAKLDELPQLLNVIKGEMSLVGPRPEVPYYVAFYPEKIREQILSVRPGITDNASIEFREENAILGLTLNPEKTYVEEILPIKLKYYQSYVLERSLWGDLILILRTMKEIARF